MPIGAPVEDIDTKPEAPKPKANGLSRINKGRVAKPRRCMLYGVQGVGKSTWANGAEKPIFLPTEEGLNDIDCDSFPKATTLDEFMGYLKELASEDHEYKTVVVDSLDWLEVLVWKKVCEEKGVTHIDDVGYGKGYTAALDHWHLVFKALDWLRDNKDMASILIAHAKIERYENPETEGYDRYAPRLNKHASGIVQEWCDEVLFATYKVYTKHSDAGFNKKVTKAVDSGQRIIRTTEKPFAMAKNRLGMPDEVEMKFSIYSDFAKGKQNGNA